MFREEYFIGESQKIDKIIFYDSGRVQDFKKFSHHQKRTKLFSIFETTVSDPVNDEVLKSFLEEMKHRYSSISPQNETKKEEYEEQVKEICFALIQNVRIFFGEVLEGEEKEFPERCEEIIKSIQRKRNTNIILLGDLKGCGLCRHRSILFKLLCDIFGINCRVLRGWLDYKGESSSHMWNEVIIRRKRYIVDTMNFENFVPLRFAFKNYRNLGHPSKKKYLQKISVKKMKTDYESKRGKHLGGGAFGQVYEYKQGTVFSKIPDTNNTEVEVVDLAVKEVNIKKLNRKSGRSDCESLVKKEIDLMNLLQHPNIVKIYGNFVTKNEYNDSIVHIVMKRYRYDGDKFLTSLNHNLLFIPHEKRTSEVLVLLLEIAKGLLYIHSFSIIHYDIKLENILINWDETKKCITDVVVADFGSSKEEKMNFLITSLPHITEKYAAPEILNLIKRKDKSLKPDQVFTTRSDVYSYGVLMKYFEKYYSDFSRIVELERRCLLHNPLERPSLWEIVHHLRSSLNHVKNVFNRKFNVKPSSVRIKELELRVEKLEIEKIELRQKISELRFHSKFSEKEIIGIENIPILYRSEYNLSFFKLENLKTSNPFDSKKLEKIEKFLVEECKTCKVVRKRECFVKPVIVKDEELKKLHHQRYLEKMGTSLGVAEIFEFYVMAASPFFIVKSFIVNPIRYQVGGSLLAGELCVRYGWAINLGGGFHHASSRSGGNGCAFGDIQLVIMNLRNKGLVKKVMIIDLDAYQGVGFERDVLELLLGDSQDTFILDCYIHKDEHPYESEAIDLDLVIGDETTDEKYLEQLNQSLKRAFDSTIFQPDVVIYNAGTNILSGDPSGCKISENGIIERDFLVWETCFKKGVPIMMLLGGGFQEKNARVVADSIKNLDDRLKIMEVARQNYQSSFNPNFKLIFEEISDDFVEEEEENEGESD